MKTCIYCKEEKLSQDFDSEHVVLKAFVGNSTPRLDVVCKECNHFFSIDHDRILSRDSTEGIQRYKFGIKSREVRKQRRIKVSVIISTDKYKNVKVKGWINGKTAQIFPFPQLIVVKDGRANSILISQLKLTDIVGTNVYCEILASSQDELEQSISIIKGLGFKFNEGSPVRKIQGDLREK